MESAIGLILGLLYIGAIIGIFVFWVKAIIDILKNEFQGGIGTKVIWLMVVFFLSILGAVIYHYVGKEQKIDTENNNELVVS